MGRNGFWTWAVITAFALFIVEGCRDGADSTSPFNQSEARDVRADSVISGAMQAAGSSLLDSATVSYRFRNNLMGYDNRGGRYVYTRSRQDSTGATIVDVLTNEGVSRSINGQARKLTPKQATAAAEGTNSITYFAFLPRALGDPAARNTYAGIDTIRGKAYHRIRVAFDETGGGNDFDDDFLYWFEKGDLSLDFLAYSYATDGGGVRFREAYNPRVVRGITMQDYRNYSTEPEGSVNLEGMLNAWRDGELKLLSEINLEDVRVSYPST